MDRSPIRDFVVGLFVFAGLGALVYLSFSIGGGVPLHEKKGLRLYALFDEIAGLTTRSPVKIGGVKVGEVASTTLDKDFRVRVAIDVNPDLQLPDDTYASIYTDGVLGDRYLALQPGGGTDILKTGDMIDHTESAIILERFIGKLMYGLTGGGGGSAGNNAGSGSGGTGAAAKGVPATGAGH